MRESREVHDDLRARLRDAAGAHEPDRAHILSRVERGMAGPGGRRPARRAVRPPLLDWFRVLGATAAVAGILAAGGYAVASAVKDEGPARQTVAVPPTPAPSPDPAGRARTAPAPGPRPGTPKESDRPRPSPSDTPSATVTAPTPTPRAPAGDTEDGPLRSDGSVDPHSNDFWAQSDVTLRATERLTSLTVTLKVRQTGGVSGTGAWRSLPEDDFTTTVAERDGFLVYTWTLRPGRTVWPGEWVFAGQYDHARGGRDAKDDGYTVTAATEDGERSSVAGDFTDRAS
ncbi:hypothetical protein [Streptomyces triticiradicis]|uniref:Uncharacterized protein n=1 Tax=Streptomyces triticiradicis TaxID=2651189 RepID=A0A7J5DGL8_9ACTN|nr:hypothetical protein [Streptomyces triticiradicis]KAB1987306.1 hypothetical protein F8144_18130 [Streptomyces triticiradicis]